MRNKQEIKDFVYLKLTEHKKMRQENPLDVEQDFISFCDVAAADFQMKQDDELAVAELLSVFVNIALPISA